jgi:hypothetical protein
MEERGSELTTSSSIVGTLVIIVHQSEPHVGLRVTSLLAIAHFVQTILVISILHHQSFKVNFRSSKSILSNYHVRSNEKLFIRLLVTERVLSLMLLPLDELYFFNAVEADNLGDILIHEDTDALFLHQFVDGRDHFGTKALADFRSLSIFTHEDDLSVLITNGVQVVTDTRGSLVSLKSLS